MNRLFFSMLTTLLLFFNACEFASILSGDSQSVNSEQENSDAATATLLNVDINGGLAGVQKNFHVTETGDVFFTDSFRPGAQWTRLLSPAQLADLGSLMADNNFFRLDDSYIDPQVADAFIYTIFYQESEQNKTVTTDGFAAPENLSKIIAGLLALISQTSENGLQLELLLSTPQIGPGETVDMTLLVTNIQDVPFILKFNSGQIFDFLVAQMSPPNSLSPAKEKLIWNWAHDKAFTQQIREISVLPGETKSYEISWDGKDNGGNAVDGEYIVRATLVSMPGGSPIQKYLDVGN